MVSQDKFLKSQKVLRLVTIDEKNSPHIVPVWYLFKGNKFYIGTNSRTKKAKNLRKKKQVAFCVDVGVNSPDIVGVMGQGKARLILKKPQVEKIAKTILLRYFKTLQNKSAKELLEDTDCIIEITPTKYANWKY